MGGTVTERTDLPTTQLAGGVIENRLVPTAVVRRSSPAGHRLRADVCVVGAGIAGLSAGVESARLGRKVVLVDALPQLGGQAVNGLIGTFAGLLSNGPDPVVLTYGIGADILRDLGASGDLALRRKHNTVMYDYQALAHWIDETVHGLDITVVLGGTVRGVNAEGRRVRSLEVATRYGDLSVSASGFVDASGDAVLSWLAGAACHVPGEGQVYGSLKVVLENVDEAHYPTPEALRAALANHGDQYGVVRKDGLANLFPGRGTATLNMNHIETPLDAVGMADASYQGRVEADHTVDFLRAQFPEAFGRARVRAYGLLGVRQTRWVVGDTQFGLADLMARRQFDDMIARTGWGVELHHERETSIWDPLPAEHLHSIPYRALTPAETDNIVAAGRCIDGDVAALSSVRVMGPCIATGAAAAHALDLAGDDSVHDVAVGRLQERLHDNLRRNDPYPDPETYAAMIRSGGDDG